MNKITKFAYLFTVYLFLYFPIGVLIVYSFNDAPYSLLWHDFTLRWYKSLLENTELHKVAFNSLLIGFLSASLATTLGTLAAVSLYRYQFYGKRLIHSLLFIIIVSPDIVTGISLLILFSTLKISLGFWTLLLSHITFCMPFVAVTVYSQLLGQNKHLLEAAKDLGANEWTIFTKILIPLLKPAILAGWLLSFTLSLDDVIISFFVTGPEFDILPLKIFSMIKVGVKPEVNALCTIMFLITLVIVLLYQFVLPKHREHS
jgi:spermidine/putrescine transport system permease protein